MAFVNKDQAAFWTELAATWAELEQELEIIAGPPGRLAIDGLDLSAGERVLDVGCGTGGTTVELASRVTPSGEVIGADIAEGMLDRARERAASLGLRHVSFVHADVQATDLGTHRFDAAFSRFGVMFFTDPVAAFSNVHRSLRPGGRLSFVCWQSVLANEWMLIPGAAVASVVGVPPQMPGPGEPGPFSLADPQRVESILKAAGFDAIDVRVHDDSVVLTEADIPARARASLRTGAGREALRDADDDTKARALAAVEDAMRSRLEDGQARLSRGVLLVRATA
jgi:SAM-dependent methyltransferase